MLIQILKEFLYAETQYRNSLSEDNYFGYLGLAEIEQEVKYNYQKSLLYSFKALQIIQNQKGNKNVQHSEAYYTFYSSQILVIIGLSFFRLKMHDKAIQMLNSALIYNSKNFNAVNYLGDVYRKNQLLQQQLTLYKFFQLQNPKKGQVLFLMGKYYSNIKDYQLCIQLFQQHLKRSRFFHSQAYEWMGKAFFHLMRYDSSVQCYIKSLQNNVINTFTYLDFADLYLINQQRQTISEYIANIKIKHIKQPQFVFMLYIYYNLIGQLVQSSEHFWSVVQPLVKQFQQHTSLAASSIQLLNKFLIFSRCALYHKDANQALIVQTFLLHRLRQQYQSQQFQLLKDIYSKDKNMKNGQLSNFFIQNYHLTKKCGLQYRKKINQYFFEYIVRYNQKEGIVVYQFLAKEKQMEEIIFKNIIMIVLTQKIKQINEVCKMIQNFTIQASQEFKIDHKYEIIRNMGSIVSLYSSLNGYPSDDFYNLVVKQLSKIAKQIMKTVNIPFTQCNSVIPTNNLLIGINTKITNNQLKLVNILNQYKFHKIKQGLKQKALHVVSQLLSSENLKRQLIKFSWKNVHYLCAAYDESLQIRLNNLFQQFIKTPKYTFQMFGLKLNNIILKEESVHSKISLSDITQLNKRYFQNIQSGEQYDEQEISEEQKDRILRQKKKAQADKDSHQQNIDIMSKQDSYQYRSEASKKSEFFFIASESKNEKQQQKIESQSWENSKISSNIKLDSRQDSSVIDKDLNIELYSSEKIKINVYTFDNLNKLFKVYCPIYYQKQIPALQLNDKNKYLASIFFKNTHDIMRYLSKKKLQLNYIAKYFVESKWCQSFAKQKMFLFQMEKGEQTYHKMNKKLISINLMKQCIDQSNKIINRIKIDGNQIEREDIKIVHYLWEKGPKEIVKYLLCIASGILELQANNIFHMDLQLRNTIKVGDIYKIMDFDWSMVYKYPENAGNRISICFDNTIMIIKILLSYDLNDAQDNADFQKAFESYLICLRQAKQDIRNLCGKQNSQQKFLKILQKYAKMYHRKQFNRLLCFFSLEEIIGKEFKKLKFYLTLFLNGKQNYEEAKSNLQRILKDSVNKKIE